MNDVEYDSKLIRLIEEALHEDIGLGDSTSEAIIPADLQGRGELLVKERGIIAGLEVAEMVFLSVDPDTKFIHAVHDGSPVEAKTIVGRIECSYSGMLKAERTALNILQRMSGIATLTRKFVEAVEGTGAKIIDTRKTAPGLRILDKRAVRLGGGTNHRFGLDDMILIKNNHITAVNGIDEAIDKSLSYVKTRNYPIAIEVETRTIDEVRHALQHDGVRRIMLDNFSVDDMKTAVRLIGGKAEVEASGNVSLLNVRAIAETGVDYISVGALTHSPKALDISLSISPLHHSS